MQRILIEHRGPEAGTKRSSRFEDRRERRNNNNNNNNNNSNNSTSQNPQQSEELPVQETHRKDNSMERTKGGTWLTRLPLSVGCSLVDVAPSSVGLFLISDSSSMATKNFGSLFGCRMESSYILSASMTAFGFCFCSNALHTQTHSMHSTTHSTMHSAMHSAMHSTMHSTMHS